MLLASRPATPVCRRNIYRTLSTITEADSTSSSTPHFPSRQNNPLRQRKHQLAPSATSRRLFVRPWDGIPSMPDALTIVRGIERRYGKVKLFKLMRDSELTTTYVPYLWVELKDPSKYKGTEVIQVPLSKIDRRRPGGVGLDDLQGLLESPDPNEPEDMWRSVTDQMMAETRRTGEAKVLDVRVELSASEEPPTPRLISHHKQFLISDAFSKWGGFSPTTDANPPQPKNMLHESHILVEEHKHNLAEQDLPNPDLVDEPQPPSESKPFNYTFDEPVAFEEAKPILQQQQQRREFGANVSIAQTIKEKQEQGKPLNKRERTLVQAALLSRTPLSSAEKKLGSRDIRTGQAERVEGSERSIEVPGEEKMETEEDKKGFQDKLWKLVGGKWF